MPGPRTESRRYTWRLGTPATPIEPRQVGILILDDDVQSQGALKQILDSEGWRVRIVPDIQMFLAELRTGEWSRDGVQIFYAVRLSSGVSATYRVFWDCSGPNRYAAATNLVIGQ